jgi:hypothetical protein
MNRSGHLTLVKSTLTAMPIYLMMCDVLRRNFIWTGKDSHQRQKHSGLAHCLPSDNMGRAGRLGVQDLELAGFALRTRWIWPQRTDEEGACSLFGWLVADGWCWFVLREEHCWLVLAGCW